MNDFNPTEKNVQSVSSELSATSKVPLVLERKIGGTTYIITGKYKEDAREGLLDKLWRLIENDTGDDNDAY